MKIEPAAPASGARPEATLPGERPRRKGPALRLPDGILYCLKVFVGIRVVLGLIALFGVALLPDFSHISKATQQNLPLVPVPVGVPGWPAHTVTPGWHNVFTAWERLDVLWFLRIAVGGYRTTDASAAFFPLFPTLIRGVSFILGGHPFAAALLIANGASLASLIVLYGLTREELSEEIARRAVLYLAVFPTALFFAAPYSESLFLLFVLLSFRAARHRRWEWAGLAGALAALTRNLGVFLVIPLAAEAVQQGLASRPRRFPVRSLWGLGPVAGTLLYLWYWHERTGDWLRPLHVQVNWGRHFTDPLITLGKAANLAFRYLGVYPGGYHTLDFVIAVPVLALAVYAIIKFRPIYGIYTLVAVIVPLTSIFEGRPLLSFSRYALPIFPLFWALAKWTADRPVRHDLTVAASAALLGLMTLLYVNWYYIL